jgi:hypothetical protein
MAKGAFPIHVHMDAAQIESHRAKWIASVERLGANWVILREPDKVAKGLIFLPRKVAT